MIKKGLLVVLVIAVVAIVVGAAVYVLMTKPPAVNQPPVVSITYPATGQTVNGTIAITGSASDPDGTVQKVEVKIDDGSWSDATGTTTWSFEWATTTVSNGWHTISARAYDGIDYSEIKFVNVNVSNLVLDTERPRISNVQAIPEMQEVYGYVNITCTVTDNIAVNIVKIAITGPTGFTPVNITMTNIPGTNNYYHNTTYSVLGTYSYFIWANDTSNNKNTSATYTFVIQDTTKPEISNIQAMPSIQAQGGYVNITAIVTDSVEVNIVKVNITGPTGFEQINITMTRIAGTDNYYYNTTYTFVGTYYYYIWANDISDNQKQSLLHRFGIKGARTPIYIHGNNNFTSANGVTSGSGTQAEPYIIENWDISASSAHGIEIRNTNVYFIIRNCVIYDGKSTGKYGIYFYNVTDGKIENVTSYNNCVGVYLSFSSNNTISESQIHNNSWHGIYLYVSSNNTISASQIHNNSWHSICLDHSSNNNISESQIYNNSYGIYLIQSSNTEIHYNNIYNNTDYGVYNYNSAPEYQANATYNWWDSATGPYHPSTNPSGTGNRVSDNVLYNPWASSPYGGKKHSAINSTLYYKAILDLFCFEKDINSKAELFGAVERVIKDIKAATRGSWIFFQQAFFTRRKDIYTITYYSLLW
ncbi:MAG: right-handed parallel beta-helix repeat-containing protein [Candidatus Thermoplasmatota archaeon]